MASTDDPTKDRRSKPAAPIHGGRRWKDDPDRAAAMERILLSLSGDVHALRELHGWSQDEMAHAAGIHPDTLGNLEKMRDDPRLSTIVSAAYAAGYEVEIRFRRPRRHPGFSRPNLTLPARS